MGLFIIGEIGINHNGDLKIAKDLIDVAKDAGCNAVKFQKRTINEVYSQEILDSLDRALGAQHKESKRKALNLERKNTILLTPIARKRKSIGLLQHGISKAKSFFVNTT